MNIRFFVCLIVVIFISCKSTNHNSAENIKSQSNEILAIKFMGSIYDYPRSISKKDFWDFKEEHTYLIFPNSFLKDEILRLKESNCSNFEEFKYAFIMEVEASKKDTIYSDHSLKTWIVKKDNKDICLYDEKGEIAQALRERFSFFRECL